MEGSAKRRSSAFNQQNLPIQLTKSKTLNISQKGSANKFKQMPSHNVNQTKNTNIGNISPHLLLRGLTQAANRRKKCH